MDLTGSLVDTNVRIYPSKKLREFLETIHIDRKVPFNVAKIVKANVSPYKNDAEINPINYNFNKKDIENLEKIKSVTIKVSKENHDESKNEEIQETSESTESIEKVKEECKGKNTKNDSSTEKKNKDAKSDSEEMNTEEADAKENEKKNREDPYLTTSDINWLYTYLKQCRMNGDKVPFLHVLLEEVEVEMPENKIIKRNPVLEERCVKLRAQQEAREYRKMTKGVDNVRMRFPEDSISYQMKQLNRQLIAVGQFILSIFAGFLFGFRGVEWMVGNLDFGFRLLLGVMCALVIALAEIYFLAKKLNEELNIPETVQLGGPTKFVEERTCHGHKISAIDKPHHD